MASVADIIATMKSKLGAPYVFGAEGPNQFDCSGLMQWAFGQHGIKLPRIAADQAKFGTRVTREQMQPGDMIFSIWDGSPVPSHVALYIGNNQYIHAPQPGQNVSIGTLNSDYWSHVTNIQRVPNLTGGTTTAGWIPGVPDPGDAADALRTMAGGVVAMGDLAKKLMWLALPTTQVRIASGVFGVGFMMVGIWLLVREARHGG